MRAKLRSRFEFKGSKNVSQESECPDYSACLSITSMKQNNQVGMSEILHWLLFPGQFAYLEHSSNYCDAKT